MNRLLTIAGVALGVALTLGMTVYAFANISKADTMLGVVVGADAAAIEVPDQPGAAGSIKVARVLAPGKSWIVVHLDEGGKPGMRVGLQPVPAGESRDVVVRLDPAVPLTDKLLVAVHADRGIAGTFEFDMKEFDSSPDKPYFVDEMELATAVRVK